MIYFEARASNSTSSPSPIRISTLSSKNSTQDTNPILYTRGTKSRQSLCTKQSPLHKREALYLPSCVEVIGFVLSCNFSVEVPLWKVLCRHSENPSVWRQGYRAVAQTSKHILLFAFDPLSLNFISLISCIVLYCTYSYTRYSCVPIFVLNQESFI